MLTCFKVGKPVLISVGRFGTWRDGDMDEKVWGSSGTFVPLLCCHIVWVELFERPFFVCLTFLVDMVGQKPKRSHILSNLDMKSLINSLTMSLM